VRLVLLALLANFVAMPFAAVALDKLLRLDDTMVGWYDQSASHFSIDKRRAKIFRDREAADLVANQLRSRYPRVAKYVDVAAIEPTAIVYIFDRNRAVAL
jgi:hypothetical protein